MAGQARVRGVPIKFDQCSAKLLESGLAAVAHPRCFNGFMQLRFDRVVGDAVHRELHIQGDVRDARACTARALEEGVRRRQVGESAARRVIAN